MKLAINGCLMLSHNWQGVLQGYRLAKPLANTL